MRNAFDNLFLLRIGSKSVYIWHSRRFEEILYMHVPRLLFLSLSIYTIYYINLRQRQREKWKNGVISHRQEAIKQYAIDVAKILNTSQPQVRGGVWQQARSPHRTA